MKNSFRSIILVATLCTVVWALAFSAGASAAARGTTFSPIRVCVFGSSLTKEAKKCKRKSGTQRRKKFLICW